MKKLLTAVSLLVLMLCALLTSLADTLILPAGVEEIRTKAFYGDTSLGEVELPEGVKTIGAYAFADSSVTTVVLPESLESIDDTAFAGCADAFFMVVPGSYAAEWCERMNVNYNKPGDGNYTVDVLQLVQHAALDSSNRGFQDALIAELGSDHVTIRFRQCHGENSIVAAAVKTALDNDTDLIGAIATPVLSAAANATNTVPIVGMAVTDYETALGTIPANVTGVSDGISAAVCANQLSKVLPASKWKTVAILNCSLEPASTAFSNAFSSELSGMGYSCTRFAFANRNEIGALCRGIISANPSIVFLPTDNTVATYLDDIIDALKNTGIAIVGGPSMIPVYKEYNDVLLRIESEDTAYYDMGYAAGLQAAEILRGRPVSSIPISKPIKGVCYLNRNSMSRFGFTSAPPGVILYTPGEWLW